jgi:hypothetical protein
LVVFLLYIAFRNILHLDIENYAIKKMIPKVLGTAVFANIALIILTLLSSMVDRLAILNIFHPQPITFTSLLGGPSAVTGAIGAAVTALVVWVASMVASGGTTIILGVVLGCGALLLAFIPAILVAALSLFIALRPWIVFIGAAVSPLAIGCTILPQTEPLFKKWLKITLFWLFYPLLVFALAYLALKIPNFSGAAGDGPISSVVGFLLPLALRFFLLLTAVRAPFMWEKDIGGIIARVGNLAGKAGLAGVGYVMGSGAYELQKRRAGKAAEAGGEKRRQNFESEVAAAGGEQAYIESNLRESAIDEFIKRQAKNAGLSGPDGVRKYLGENRAENETDDDVKQRIASENQGEVDELGKQMFERRRAEEIAKGKRDAVIGPGGYMESLEYRFLEGLQKFNPSGALQAIKRKFELGDKEREKAHWRKSFISQLIAGPIVTQQVQREIAKDDLSGIYTIEDFEKFLGPTMEKMVKAYIEREKRKGVNISEEEATARIQNEMEFLHRTAAGKLDYDIAFGDLIGLPTDKGPFTPHDLANAIEGYGKQRQLVSQTARSMRSAAEQQELTKSLALESTMRMVRGPSGAVEAATGRDVSGHLTLADKKMISLLNGIRQDLRQSGGSKTPFDIAEARVQSLDLSDITQDHYLNLVGQTNNTLSQIGQYTNDPNFVQALIDSNGMNIESLMGRIGNDTKLQDLVQNFQVQRLTQLALSTKVEGAQTVERISQMIIKQELDDNAIQRIKNACASFAKPNIAPAELESSKNTLGSVLGRGGETITHGDALKIARALEVLVPRKPTGSQGATI